VDGLIVVASICLVELSGRIQSAAAAHQQTAADVPPAAGVVEPEPLPVPADLDSPAPSEPAGQKVRPDPRSAREIETAVRAIWTPQPGLSQRKIAALAATSQSNAGRIIRDAKAEAATPAESATGELAEAGKR
jgi:hypothetical protein